MVRQSDSDVCVDACTNHDGPRCVSFTLEPSPPSKTTTLSSSTPPIPPAMPDVNESTPLDVVNQEFSKAGLTPQYKRRCKDGSLIDASEAELNVLKAQAHVASTAQALQHMEITEKTAWAIDSKELANELYSRGMIKEAMNKYMEALAATDFDAQTGNIDVLVIPVLCNLAACCIELKAYRKGVRFCDQALTYRPNCLKAFSRKGLCLVHLGEFDEAMVVLNQAKRLATDAMVGIQQLADEKCAQLAEMNLLKMEDTNLLRREEMNKAGVDEIRGTGEEERNEEMEVTVGGKDELKVERDEQVRMADDERFVRGSRDQATSVGGEEDYALQEGNETESGGDHRDAGREGGESQQFRQRQHDTGADAEEGNEQDEQEEEEASEEEGGEEDGERDEEWEEAASAAWQLDQLRESMRKINGYLARAQRGVSLQKQAENTQKEAMRRVFGGPIVIPITRNKTGRDRNEDGSLYAVEEEEEEEDDEEEEDEEGIIEWVFRLLWVIQSWFLQLLRRLLGSPVLPTQPTIKSKES